MDIKDDNEEVISDLEDRGENIEGKPIKEYKPKLMNMSNMLKYGMPIIISIVIIVLMYVLLFKVSSKIFNEAIANQNTNNKNRKVNKIDENNNMLNYSDELNNIEFLDCDEKTKEYTLYCGEKKYLPESEIVISLNKADNFSNYKYSLCTLYYKNQNNYIIEKEDKGTTFFVSNNYELKVTEIFENGIKFKIMYNDITFNNRGLIDKNKSCNFVPYNNMKISLEEINDLRDSISDDKAKIECKIIIEYKGDLKEYILKLGEKDVIKVDKYILKFNGADINQLEVNISEIKDYNSNYSYETEYYFKEGRGITIASDNISQGIVIQLEKIIEDGKYSFKINDGTEEKNVLLDVLEHNIEEIDNKLRIQIIETSEDGVSLKILYI